MFVFTTLLLYLLGALTYTQVSKRMIISLAPSSSRKDQKSMIYLMSVMWPLLASHLILIKICGR